MKHSELRHQPRHVNPRIQVGWYLFAFLWLVALWILILATTVAFYRISKPAAWLMLPYLVWVAFAGYLNLGVWWLNR